ncbi:hypothetical protein DVH05_014303 [Phytophthora capsici]|nr:hypothetical protein DVH05_014303 [Phytophthora capsici]
MLNPIENVFSAFKSKVKDFMTERRAQIIAVPQGTTMKAHRQQFLQEAAETLFPLVATAQLCASCYRHTLVKVTDGLGRHAGGTLTHGKQLKQVIASFSGYCI